MKTYIYKIFTIALFVLSLMSCEQNSDEGLTTLETVSFSTVIEATPNNIVLSTANNFESVVSLSWSEVEFPIDAPVTYTLALDVPPGNFDDTAIRISAGEDVLSSSISGKELNEYAAELGLEPDVEGNLMFRVEAYMDRYVYSEPVPIQVTPFIEEIAFGEVYMPGSYNGWDPSTASRLSAISTGVYEGYVTVTSPQGLEFKITPEQNWDNFYGLDNNGKLTLGADGDLLFPDFGSYKVTINLNTLTYSIISYSWGVIGNSTPGGWDVDTDMSYDHTTSTWKYNGDLIPGALKFRLNNEWTTNYGTEDGNGGEITDGVMYLDNPGAHNIIEAGTYEVTFSYDSNATETIIYSIIKL